jgi:hypothetical protein
MGVQRNRNADLAFELFDHPISNLRLDDSRHVLNAKRVATHFLELNPKLNKVVYRVDGTDRVTELATGMLPMLFHRLNGSLQIAHII